MSANSQTGNALLIAVPAIVLAIFLFDVQGVLIKQMGQRYSIEQITLFRNIFGIVPHLLVLFFFSTESVKQVSTWKLKRWKLGLGRGLMLISAQVCFYTAIVSMQFATATTLAFSGPLFITMLSIPLLGLSVGIWRWGAVVLGFAGVVMIMRPGTDVFNPMSILPVMAAVFYAAASISSRLFEDSESTAIINIYSTFAAGVAALLIVLFTGQWTSMTSAADWFWFIGMGSVGGCAVLLLITAYRMAEPSLLSPFEYFGIPFSFFLGWVFFDEAPFETLFPGVLLIVSAGLLVVWRERINQAKSP